MVDVCVIGGGPAGLFSAYYCQARGLKTLLLEANSTLGGRLRLYRHMAIYDLPGQYGVTGEKYLQGLVEQVERAKVDVHCKEQLVSVTKVGELFELSTTSASYMAKTVIVATGNGYQTLKQIEGIDDQLASFVSYEMEEIPTSHLKIAVVGYNPMAIDWAIQLKSAGHDVTLFTKELHKIQLLLTEQLERLNIKVMPFKLVKELRMVEGQPSILDERFAMVYVHLGVRKETIFFTPKFKLIDNGLTTVSGLFVAGDVRNESGKLKLLIGAAHDAMQAVNEANRYLNPGDYYQPIVSTHHPIFKEWNE